MKLPKYYVMVCLLFLLTKARQVKRKHNQNDGKTKNEVTKVWSEPGIRVLEYFDTTKCAVLFFVVVSKCTNNC